MKPYNTLNKFRRKKRNHKIKCLKCDLIFLSRDLKTHRICDKCKLNPDWIAGDDEHSILKW